MSFPLRGRGRGNSRFPPPNPPHTPHTPPFTTPSPPSLTATTPAEMYPVPSPDDVLKVKGYLVRKSLPLEIADLIIDYAEYWPCTIAVNNSRINVSDNGTEIYLRSVPIAWGLRRPKTNQTCAQDTKKEGTEKKSDTQDNKPWEEKEEYEKEVFKPRGKHPCRRIVWKIWSHDQGWSSSDGKGSYVASWTWFETHIESTKEPPPTLPSSDDDDIESPESEKLETPPAQELQETSQEQIAPEPTTTNKPWFKKNRSILLQKNKHAHADILNHTITWDAYVEPTEADSYDLETGSNRNCGDFVRSLEVGDRVALSAIARYPGWVNTVDRAEVWVYWAV